MNFLTEHYETDNESLYYGGDSVDDNFSIYSDDDEYNLSGTDTELELDHNTENIQQGGSINDIAIAMSFSSKTPFSPLTNIEYSFKQRNITFKDDKDKDIIKILFCIQDLLLQTNYNKIEFYKEKKNIESDYRKLIAFYFYIIKNYNLKDHITLEKCIVYILKKILINTEEKLKFHFIKKDKEEYGSEFNKNILNYFTYVNKPDLYKINKTYTYSIKKKSNEMLIKAVEFINSGKPADDKNLEEIFNLYTSSELKTHKYDIIGSNTFVTPFTDSSYSFYLDGLKIHENPMKIYEDMKNGILEYTEKGKYFGTKPKKINIIKIEPATEFDIIYELLNMIDDKDFKNKILNELITAYKLKINELDGISDDYIKKAYSFGITQFYMYTSIVQEENYIEMINLNKQIIEREEEEKKREEEGGEEKAEGGEEKAEEKSIEQLKKELEDLKKKLNNTNKEKNILNIRLEI